jgi:hypothetical protein
MKNAYLQFLTSEDKATGFELLSHRATVIELDKEIFCVPLASLDLLNEQGICYNLVSYEVVEKARHRTWHFDLAKMPAPA